MPYVQPLNLHAKLELDSLFLDYKELTGVDLETAKTPNFFQKKVGVKNAPLRRSEMTFIHKWSSISQRILQLPDLTSEKFFQANSIVHAAYQYIAHEIGDECTFGKSTARSITKKILDKRFSGGVRSNIMNKEELTLVFFQTRDFLNSISRDQLMQAAKPAFKSDELLPFKRYIRSKCSQLQEPENYYPCATFISSITKPTGYLLGSSIGYVVGKGLTHTAFALPIQYQMTAMLGSGLYFMMGDMVKTGILVLGPTYAARIFETASGFSLSWLLGITMGFFAEILGLGLGIPFDLVLRALAAAFQAGNNTNKLPSIDGFIYKTGQSVAGGLPITSVTQEKIEKVSKQAGAIVIELKYLPNGSINYSIIDDSNLLKLDSKSKVRQLLESELKSPIYLEELKSKLPPIIDGDELEEENVDSHVEYESEEDMTEDELVGEEEMYEDDDIESVSCK